MTWLYLRNEAFRCIHKDVPTGLIIMLPCYSVKKVFIAGTSHILHKTVNYFKFPHSHGDLPVRRSESYPTNVRIRIIFIREYGQMGRQIWRSIQRTFRETGRITVTSIHLQPNLITKMFNSVLILFLYSQWAYWTDVGRCSRSATTPSSWFVRWHNHEKIYFKNFLLLVLATGVSLVM